jgi:hypothetical protein
MNLRFYCVLFLFFSVTISVFSQKRLTSEKGMVSFASNAELEVIKASSEKVVGLMDPATNRFAFSISIESFQGFNSSLQRSHFNENYMESTKFPNATFTGKIIEQVDLTTSGTYDIRAKGDLIVHGETQSRIIRAKIIITKEGAQVEAQFIVSLVDHNIQIPKIVNRKIASEILVNYKSNFSWK